MNIVSHLDMKTTERTKMCTEYPAAMPELSTLTIFVGAAMLLFIVPGPAVLYVVTRSL